MRCPSSLFAALAVSFAVTSPGLAQQADTTEQALEEISDWLGSKLKKFGRFSLRLSTDWSRVRIRPSRDDMRTVEARHEIRDVSFEKCELRYTSYFKPPGTGEPLFWNVVFPLRLVHIPKTRVQRYELPMQLRATTQRYEVVLFATGEGFTVTDYDRRQRTVWEYAIPVDRKRNAEEVAETLRHAAQLCGARPTG